MTGIAGVASITAGGSHECAIKQDATVGCWGYNYNGQLGDGTTTDRTTPTAVPWLDGVTDVAAGGTYSLRSRKTVRRTAGDQLSGQLKDGSAIDKVTPTPGGPVVTGY
ncbi:MAG: hypothetical protein IPQ14_04075 [Candidatus Microthrix sp.]|uniref:RCC1 domain-containing protein n=1 Tax=Candidatus Neomicrothrix sp. TaxID=2719034 RepID=UPI0025C2FA49|nr:RCC1 domain-containing protein [Candidatus Microthrix sp.]MBL0203518.1 hypothetical protein [Candidatus Microthrix sp.]